MASFSFEGQHEQIQKQFLEEYQTNKPEAWQKLYKKLQIPKRWTIVLEHLMKEFIKASVELGKYSEIRVIMNTYRNFTQGENTESLEGILKYYQDAIEKKFEENMLGVEFPADIHDIEIQDTPEDLMLLCFDTEGKQKRDSIKSNLKMKLDCYKTIIENVKVNRKLEGVMKKIIEKILEFFQKYERKSELSKFVFYLNKQLYEIRANSSENLQRYPNYIDLASKETQQNQLDIRFDVFNVCKKYNLYQCCLKMMEDVKVLIKFRMHKRDDTKKRYISMYYENMAEIFLKSKFYNMYAFFHLQHFNYFFRYKTDFVQEEVRRKADSTILSILSIPFNSVDTKFPIEKKKCTFQMKDFILDSSRYIPNYEEMIKVIQNNNILDHCSPEIQQIYSLIATNKMSIFSISKNLNAIFKSLGSNHEQFQKLIKEKISFKILQQLSLIYRTLKVERLVQIIDFIDQNSLISILLEANQISQLKCTFNAKTNVIQFGKNQRVESASGAVFLFTEKCKRVLLQVEEEKKTNANDKKQIQLFMADAQRSVSERMQKIRNMKIRQMRRIDQEQREEEYQEEKLRQMEVEQKRQQQVRLETMEKARKLKRDEHLRIIKEKLEEVKKIKEKQIAKIGGVKIEDLDEEDMLTISAETVVELKNQILEAQKNDVADRAKKMFQKFDYIVRECRKVENENIEQVNSGTKEENQACVDQSKKIFEDNLEFKNSIEKTQQFKEHFFAQVLSMREKKHVERMKKFKEVCEEFREPVQNKALALFEEDKKQKEIEQKEEEERKKQELEDKIETQKEEENVWRNKNKVPDQIVPVEEDNDNSKSKDEGMFRKGGASAQRPAYEESNKKEEQKSDMGFRKGGNAPTSSTTANNSTTDSFRRGQNAASTSGGWSKGTIVRDPKVVEKEKAAKQASENNDQGWSKVSSGRGGEFNKGGDFQKGKPFNKNAGFKKEEENKSFGMFRKTGGKQF